jgi:hypothetical protein
MKVLYGVVLLHLFAAFYLFGQDTTRARHIPLEVQQPKPITAPADSLKQKDIFIDRDGDGINDLLMRTSWMRMGRFRKGSFGTADGSGQKEGSGFGPGQQQGNQDATGPKQQPGRRGRKTE